jgi:hypothetical protein
VSNKFNKSPVASAVQCAYRNTTPGINAPNAQKWDDLEETYQAMAHGIVTIGESVNAVLHQPDIKDELEARLDLKIAVSGLFNDLHTFTNMLVKIRHNHLGKKGFIQNDNELVAALEIFDHYTQFNIQFKSVTLPTFATIMDTIQEVIQQVAISRQHAAAVQAQPVIQPV